MMIKKNDDYITYLNTVTKRLEENRKRLEVIKGKDVIMVMGSGNVGKSTFANVFASSIENVTKNEMTGKFEVNEPVKYNGVEMFKIGHKCRSQTRIPGIYPLQNDEDS